jgi:hypothetical protein
VALLPAHVHRVPAVRRHVVTGAAVCARPIGAGVVTVWLLDGFSAASSISDVECPHTCSIHSDHVRNQDWH